MGVSYIEWIDITGQYLVYNNNDVMVTSINEIDQNNCTWLLEEYTEYYEEYYKTFNIDFPVVDTKKYKVQSSRAWRDLERIYIHLHYSVIIDNDDTTHGFSNTIDPLLFYDRDQFVYIPGT